MMIEDDKNLESAVVKFVCDEGQYFEREDRCYGITYLGITYRENETRDLVKRLIAAIKAGANDPGNEE